MRAARQTIFIMFVWEGVGVEDLPRDVRAEVYVRMCGGVGADECVHRIVRERRRVRARCGPRRVVQYTGTRRGSARAREARP